MEWWSGFDSSTEDVIKPVWEHGLAIPHAIDRSCARTEKALVPVLSHRELGIIAKWRPVWRFWWRGGQLTAHAYTLQGLALLIMLAGAR